MEKMKYHLEVEQTLDESDDDENLVTMVDNSSVVQPNLLQTDIGYTFKSDDVIYRVVQLSPGDGDVPISSNQTAEIMTTQYYLINNDKPVTTGVKLIAPKTEAVQNNVEIKTVLQPKKRDERRRAVHNEVERRRRDKINHLIMKLGDMIPADGCSSSVTEGHSLSTAENHSKGKILSTACEYISTLQDEIKQINECLLDYEKLKTDNIRLENENDELRERLKLAGISVDLCS